MNLSSFFPRFAAGVAAIFFAAFMGASENAQTSDSTALLAVPKASCGVYDHPETGLQGQVPAALRAIGFRGFNCNLELIAQVRGDGANWQTTQYSAGSRRCAYHGTASPTLSLPGRQNLGVPVIDITDPNNPMTTAHLASTSMLDPWESLKINERRRLLGAINGTSGNGPAAIDIYDGQKIVGTLVDVPGPDQDVRASTGVGRHRLRRAAATCQQEQDSRLPAQWTQSMSPGAGGAKVQVMLHSQGIHRTNSRAPSRTRATEVPIVQIGPASNVWRHPEARNGGCELRR